MDGVLLKTPLTSPLVKQKMSVALPDCLTILEETEYEFNLEYWVLTGLQSGFANKNWCQTSSPASLVMSPSCPPYWMMFSPQQRWPARRHSFEVNCGQSSLCPKVLHSQCSSSVLESKENTQKARSVSVESWNALSAASCQQKDSRTQEHFQQQHSDEETYNNYAPVKKLASTQNRSTTQMALLPPGLDCSAELISAMSSQEREVLESIIAQGYSLQTAISAMQKIGSQAPDKIFTYLLSCDQLCQLGYDHAQVEEALDMFQNCKKKAEEFLQLLTQFDEMGFQQNVIKEVLLIHENHRERALEELMMRVD